MKTLKTGERVVLTPCLETLLLELGDECQNVIKYLDGLKKKTLTKSQAETILDDLSTSVLHLQVHTKGLTDLIDDEIERM
jgi:hypothetical protein